MQIVIHRGTHQIGGCCTEIRTEQAHILIDFGDELPEPGQTSTPLELEGVTFGEPNCDGVFFTHYHGDHVGQLPAILPGIPLYMGGVAKEIFTLYQQRVAAHRPAATAETLAAIRPLHPLGRVRIGDIQVLPLVVDHSAYDSYMLLIEVQGKKILHTGDYCLHGLRGEGVLTALEKYVGQVDVLITEGTTLSRTGQNGITEADVERDAAALMGEYPYVFALCASTNIDRLATFYSAAKKAGRLFVCDDYQKSILDVVTRHSGPRSPFFGRARNRGLGRLQPRMEEQGFCMPVRAGRWAEAWTSRFDPEKSMLVYSMWPGYLERDAALKALVDSHKSTVLHASGHGTPQEIRAVCDAVRPRQGVIPIHTDAPERLAQVAAPYSVIPLEDGVAYELR